MSGKPIDRLRMAVFTSFAPAGPPNAPWDSPGNRDFDYLDLANWSRLAKAAEDAKFDAIFWADHNGVHDVYQGSWRTAVREAVQFPSADPMLLSAALVGATSNLGFAFSANVIQDHPYAFARRLSTLDSLSKGRVGWNIVTSFQESAWRNLGHGSVDTHRARYERADDYLRTLYAVLEGSWEDGAVVRDLERRIFADPDRVHEVHHHGPYYAVDGIHASEPSPQRMPVLFQAGSSEDGRAFSAQHAECVFIANQNVAGAASFVSDLKRRASAAGRSPDDVLFFEHLSFVVGSTEAEAKRKEKELEEYLSSEAILTFVSSTMGLDMSTVDLDRPIGDFSTEAMQGQLRGLAAAAPDRTWTFRDLVLYTNRARVVGTPEQIADELETWRAAGINGINVTHMAGAEEIFFFFEHVVPVLQSRGMVQHQYAPGTFREKLYAGRGQGAHLNERHPASLYRPLSAANVN